MNAEATERILGYFIEEAKEHLETLEQGILDLSTVVNDSERVNEMFRAAHSVKGGAAMLGYTSIQKTAHKLEDSFKILREQDLEVDQNLESLFFAGYDVLQDLIDKLQSDDRLQDEEGLAIFKQAEPNFVKLQDYLDQIVANGGKIPEVAAQIASSPSPEKSELGFSEQVKQTLKQMLQLFKQPATPESRQQIQQMCLTLGKLAPDQAGWQKLLQTAAKAVSNPKYSYGTLAPVVIKEVKLGSDAIELDKGEQVGPSYGLQQLAQASFPQIMVTVEPKSAAETLINAFNKQQLSQLVKHLEAKV